LLETERQKVAAAEEEFQLAELVVADLEGDVDKLTNDLADQTAKNAELAQQLKTATTERDTANTRYTEILRTNRTLTDEQRKARRELDLLRAEIAELKKKELDD
jgi:chromosome segregation ATPase